MHLGKEKMRYQPKKQVDVIKFTCFCPCLISLKVLFFFFLFPAYILYIEGSISFRYGNTQVVVLLKSHVVSFTSFVELHNLDKVIACNGKGIKC